MGMGLKKALVDRLARQFADRLAAGPMGAATQRALLLAAGLSAQHARNLPDGSPLSQAEFSAFSQWGEDGIIQYLLAKSTIPEPTFVEFGVENYVESNTRFLLTHNNWKGLVIDGSQKHIDFVKADPISWRHDLDALCAFITRDNINDLIARRFPGPELGLLSIDIDGNDYWVWKAIDRVKPTIVICEYNALFGTRVEVSIPYQPDFSRLTGHHSGMYYGASLRALCRLGADKGYAFVGCNSAGNDAFFVRQDRLRGVQPLQIEQGYVESRFRDSRDENGKLTFASGIDRLRLIQDLPVVDLPSGRTLLIREVLSQELA